MVIRCSNSIWDGADLDSLWSVTCTIRSATASPAPRTL